MFIQVMDLGVIVLLCKFVGTLILCQKAWGYLLALKFLTMGLYMGRVVVPGSVVELDAFSTIALVDLVMVVLKRSKIKLT